MAAVYSAGDFRNGTTFEMDGNVYRVVEFQHVKPGKGSAFVRTKIKNVITGSVLEKTFNPSEKYPAAEIEKKDMQYLYEDSGLYYFMDNETYEQIPLNADQLGDSLKFLKENMVKKNSVIIDVGINRDDNGKIIGDVDFENVSKKSSYITPVPGGVGPMTIAMLMNNVIKAAENV